MEKKLVVVDGSSLLYRAFFGLPPLSYHGIPTNAVMGFLNMLYDIYKNFDPEYMAVSFDKNKQTFRSEVYKEYKATRKPAPPELVPQFALIREALRTLGAAVYEVDGYEGDDILGTLAARYEKELPVFIVTGDRDALQLATKDTTVYITQRGVSQMAAMTPEAVVEKYGITPRQVIDMKALMGDTSDNIPGVPGVGEKTAAKLLSQYQTLDNLYGHVGEIKGAVGKKLAANKELAYLSYRLATIKTDVPFEATLEEMKQPVHFEEMMEFFHRLGLERIADRYSTLPRFRELAVSKKKEIQAAAVKLEEFPLHPDFTGKEVSLVLHMEGKAPFYHADLAVVGYGNHVYRALPERFEDVCMALAAAKHVIVQDSKSIYESDFPYMAELFGTSPVFPDHLDTEEEKSACICGFLLSLYATSLEHMKSNGVQSLFEKIENPLAAVLAEMEKAGIATDQKRWEAVCHELKVRERKLLSLIYEAAGEEFNVNSPKQLGVILFEKMGMPAGKKTKNGYSTAADVLEMLAKSYPFVKDILEYRTISTVRHCLCLSALKRDGFIHHLIRQLPPQDVCPARIPICRIFLSVQQKGGKFVRFSSRGRDMTALFLPIILKWNSVYWLICQGLKRLPQNSGLTRRLSISALFTESVTSVLPISLASAAARRERI